MMSGRFIWKITFVGEPDTGKSSIVSRIVFDSEVGNFSGKGLLRKKVSFSSGNEKKQAEFIIQEVDGFPSDNKVLIGSAAILIVVDVTKKFQPDKISRFISGVDKKLEVCIVANKIDLKYEALTWLEELEPFAKKNHVSLYMVSSRVSDSVNSMIQEVAQKLMVRVNGKQKS